MATTAGHAPAATHGQQTHGEKHGLDAGRISTISFGKEQPIDGGSGEDAWQK